MKDTTTKSDKYLAVAKNATVQTEGTRKVKGEILNRVKVAVSTQTTLDELREQTELPYFAIKKALNVLLMDEYIVQGIKVLVNDRGQQYGRKDCWSVV